jgi:hypothetical protein
MKDAPTPFIFNGIVLHQDDIYQVDFTSVNKAIMIKCYNTDDKNKKNEIYSYKLTEDEIIKTCGDYSTFINKLKTNASGILGMEKFNNSQSFQMKRKQKSSLYYHLKNLMKKTKLMNIILIISKKLLK